MGGHTNGGIVGKHASSSHVTCRLHPAGLGGSGKLDGLAHCEDVQDSKEARRF